jgi:hypothetical protein
MFLLLGALIGIAVTEGDTLWNRLTNDAPQGKARRGTEAFKPNNVKLSSCDDADSNCMEQAFGNIAYHDGAKAALGLLAKHIGTKDNIDTYCHRLAHASGAGALLRNNNDIGKTFAEGDSTCWSGYYHGILERAFAGVPDNKLAATSSKLCTSPDVRKTNFLHYQCVHGLGHGLMLHTAYDLPKALKVCESLTDSWESTSCDSGVFMENIATSRGVKSRYIKDDDPVYPCQTVAERHKLYCYLMVTSRMNELNGYNWKDTARQCREDAEPKWRDTCFQSYGRDASGTSHRQIKPVATKCDIAGPTYEDECIWGAVRDMVSEDARPDRAAKFCGLVDTKYLEKCFDGIGTIIADQQPDDAARTKECRRVAGAQLAACLGGARVA